MTSVGTYQNIQNGGVSEGPVFGDPTFRFIRNGRDLAAYTRVDVLFQAYFTALLKVWSAMVKLPLLIGTSVDRL